MECKEGQLRVTEGVSDNTARTRLKEGVEASVGRIYRPGMSVSVRGEMSDKELERTRHQIDCAATIRTGVGEDAWEILRRSDSGRTKNLQASIGRRGGAFRPQSSSARLRGLSADRKNLACKMA